MNAVTSGRISMPRGRGQDDSHSGIEALLRSAVRDVLIMSSGMAAGSVGALHRIDRDNLRRGIRYRVLFPDSARMSRKVSTIAQAGAEVRTDAQIPVDALVVDGQTAILLADRSGSERIAHAAVFRLPGVVTATIGLFERIWPDAVPLTPLDLPVDTDGSMLSDRERALLIMLCAGSTDETAASRLGISVRTVRRMVADIMNRLGARSRFQAGAKAADRGWLPDRTIAGRSLPIHSG